MAAPIVYEGAARRIKPLQQGTGLFHGATFWLSHTVPERHDRIQIIQNNGGKVIKQEKKADYLIINPHKDRSSVDSYSYQLIDDSVKNGSLRDVDQYLCRSRSSRPAASAASGSSTRLPFTEGDDMRLRQWVSKKQQLGEAASGNVIYKEFAEKHPNHSWHSWRDRWLKRLRNLPPPRDPDAKQSPPQARQTTEPSAQASPSPPRVSSVGEMEGTKFTKQEDDLIIRHIQDSIRMGMDTSGDAIFHEFARVLPRHSEESCRERWLKHLKPRYKDKLTQRGSDELPEEPEPEPESTTRRNIGRNSDKATPVAGFKPINSKEDRPYTRHGSNAADESPLQSVAELEETVETEDQETGQQQQSPRSSPSKVQAQKRARQQSQVPEDASVDLHQSPRSEQSMKNQFYTDYQTHAKINQYDFVPLHTIKGRTFEPWALWHAVMSQKMVPEERDWQQIAEKLGFDWIQHETIHDELRECYEKHLASFEEDIAGFTSNGEDSEGSEDDQGTEDEDEGGRDLEAPLPSSPPIRPSLKRPLDSTSLSAGQPYPQSSPKRQKINRDGVIPSTPDDVNGTSHLRRRADINTSPLKHVHQGIADDDAAEDEAQDIVQDLPALPGGKKKAVEPETQDFKFDAETQNHVLATEENEGFESQSNITPSQQLLQESDAIPGDLENDSPTPRPGIQNTEPVTPTPERSSQIPLRQDSNRISGSATTTGRFKAAADTPIASKTKRRSLPKSFSQRPSPNGGTSASMSRQRARSPFVEGAQSVRRSTPAEETPEDVIDRFCSLGYSKPIVMKALAATTWRLGDAGQVMEMLRQGGELPQRTHGVWTQRDDDALKMVTTDAAPRDEKGERKRAKAQKRLEEKHGPELMELRRKYLWEVV
ncbi:TRF2-interacting telomeric protein/Rap1 C terminal domain-containing protein [Hypoxylon sp. FL1284]|nr:TRF2-interacting telomeric protein/Rap1 C terminal domain-containing protein [Hypoxylon sp. FL1284]